jgi:hypothetical protein
MMWLIVEAGGLWPAFSWHSSMKAKGTTHSSVRESLNYSAVPVSQGWLAANKARK